MADNSFKIDQQLKALELIDPATGQTTVSLAGANGGSGSFAHGQIILELIDETIGTQTAKISLGIAGGSTGLLQVENIDNGTGATLDGYGVLHLGDAGNGHTGAICLSNNESSDPGATLDGNGNLILGLYGYAEGRIRLIRQETGGVAIDLNAETGAASFLSGKFLVNDSDPFNGDGNATFDLSGSPDNSLLIKANSVAVSDSTQQSICMIATDSPVGAVAASGAYQGDDYSIKLGYVDDYMQLGFIALKNGNQIFSASAKTGEIVGAAGKAGISQNGHLFQKEDGSNVIYYQHVVAGVATWTTAD